MKKISTLMLLGLAFGSIQAAQISQSQALGVASKYVAVSGPQKLVRAVDKSYGGSLRTTFSIQPTAKVLSS